MELDMKMLTDAFGVGGAVLAVVAGLFKIMWPSLERHFERRAKIQEEELTIRRLEQNNAAETIKVMKITNGLVEKNNEAFKTHNAVFEIYVETMKEIRDGQTRLKETMHNRFDVVEDKIDNHHGNAIKIEQEQSAILANLNRIHGDYAFPEKEKPNGANEIQG